jgi:lysophospholipase L1-like esterase
MSPRTAIYVALSGAVSLPFFIDAWLHPDLNATLWLALAGVNLALWSSWFRFRSLLLSQLSMALSMLVVANLVLSPLIMPLAGRSAPTLPPNMAVNLHIEGDAIVGIDGTQFVSTDDHGYRTNGPIDYAHKPSGVLRIVAIGGSTTEELFLDDRKTWPSLVAEQISKALGRKVEMINTGVSGLRAEQNFLTFQGSAAFEPDIAIFMLGINDWNHAIWKANRPALDAFLDRFKFLSFFDSVLYRGLKNARTAVSALATGSRGTQDWTEDGSAFSRYNNSLSRPREVAFRPEAVDGEYAVWVGKIVAECRRRGILCIFTDQPIAYDPGVEPELRRRFWMTPPRQNYTVSLEDMRRTARLYNAWLEGTVRASGFHFCPVGRGLQPTTEFFFDDCHFTEAGARRVAELIAGCLMNGQPSLAAMPGARALH